MGVFTRIKRDALNEVPDHIVSAASVIGAPMTEQASGFLVKVIPVSGEQLTRLENKLLQYIRESPSFGESKEVQELLQELKKCSHLYVVSNCFELLLVSDRSAAQYQQVWRLDTQLSPKYVAFQDECSRFVNSLRAITA